MSDKSGILLRKFIRNGIITLAVSLLAFCIEHYTVIVPEEYIPLVEIALIPMGVAALTTLRKAITWE